MSTQTEFIRKYNRHKKCVTLCRILIFIALFLLWETAACLKWIDPFIFSSPSRMALAFMSLTTDGAIFAHTGITLLETWISFVLVTLTGLLAAMILWWNRSLSDILEPYLIALNSLPKTALAPVLIVWLGNNMKTIIVCAILLAVFGTVIHLYAGFIATDTDRLLLIRTLGGTKKDELFRVVIPENFPSMIGSMKVNIGLCLVGVIIGEFLAANMGLGYLIIYGSQVFKLDWVMMSIVILCLTAAGLYKAIDQIEHRYLSGAHRH